VNSFNRKSLSGLPTLMDLLVRRAQMQPGHHTYTFLKGGEAATESLSNQDLDQQARAIGAQLRDYRVRGERVLILLPPGLHYISAFFGCLYAGAIAVPAYPPRPKRPPSRLLAIIRDAQPVAVLTDTALSNQMRRRSSRIPELEALRWSMVDEIDLEAARQWEMPALAGEDLAFLQYTSGSTAAPKGVMVSHHNLLHNMALISKGFGHISRSQGVFWLPPYHDMGMIGGILQPLYSESSVTLMSPVDFLQRPLRWLQAISKCQAAVSGGPNFAYELCADRIAPKALAELDLSSWEVAFNGAEPIRAETLDRFATIFEPCGFRRAAFYPCYGMAEATLFVTGGQKETPPIYLSVKDASLQTQQVVEAEEADDCSTLVGCGQAPSTQRVVIVHPETCRACDDNQVGEIWVAGPSVAQGYWNQPEQTQVAFYASLADTQAGPFLRTGDLGFLRQGELFVTGRLKDLIIIRGHNYYPQDIELTVERSHPALRPACGAAFAVEADAQERLVIVQEIKRSYLRNLNVLEVVQAIRQGIAEHHDLQAYAILLLKTGSIPKISSGKIQRHACKQGFQTRSLSVVDDWSENPRHKAKVMQLGTDLAALEQQVASVKSVVDPSAQVATQAVFRAPSDRSAQNVSASIIEGWLTTQIAGCLKIDRNQIDAQAPFSSYGLDSVTAVSLSGELEEWLDRRLSPTLIYDYPTVAQLAQHLATEHLPESEPVAAPAQSYGSDAIAIVGLGCRFPGADSPDAFWELLSSGKSAVVEVPRDRWPFEETGAASAVQPQRQWGGLLQSVDQFDAAFFGIAPREAEKIDPQQRWLLEVAWEALEHAGQPPRQLSGSRTGVFVGISSNDYARKLATDSTQVDAYVVTGNALSIAANRLSYLLNLRGPSLAVDTACSSSLVAVHLACQSLRQRECDLALVGGVNALLSPELTQAFSQAQMMAADGRCKTFDATADGYVRGEGCGVVVLKRLRDAKEKGDRILAIIRGSAVNQDGRSNGLTAPNGPAQQSVVRQALSNANVAPAQIQYVETHGTGTPLGDPIEVEALQAVLADGRSANTPCYLGSVKTNVGHLEASAGIAGLIKGVLALQHQEIPPHLNLTKLNPHITLEQTPFIIATETQRWSTDTPFRLAGVSSFGFGGTNAHVVLEASPVAKSEAIADRQPMAQFERPLHLLTLSAKTPAALEALVSRHARHWQAFPDANIADICFSANTGRSHFDYRLSLIATSTEQLQKQLGAYQPGQAAVGIHQAHTTASTPPQVAFLFTGQGAQAVGMGRSLYETQPTFRRALDRCDEILQGHLDKSLLRVLYPTVSEDESLIHQTAYTQPALFALEYALAQLWQSWGIRPSAVLGHSIGEYVAAHLAGVFSLEDGLVLIAARGRLMQALPQNGRMVVVASDAAQVEQLIQPYGDDVAIAAVNGPKNVVISGRRDPIAAIVAALSTRAIKTKPLPVSHAFHSPLMKPMVEAFRQVAAKITWASPQTLFISTVTGEIAPAEITTPDYWVDHVCQPVRFAAAMDTLQHQDCSVFLEIGPKTILLGMGQTCLPDRSVSQFQWLPSLRAEQADWSVLLKSLSQLYGAGIRVDWPQFDRGYNRTWVPLPTYPFQRQPHWIADQPTANASQVEANGSGDRLMSRQSLGNADAEHPLLGRPLTAAAHRPGEHLWSGMLNAQRLPYLAEHRLWGSAVLFLGAYVEMALAAAKAALGASEDYRLTDLQLHTPLFLPDKASCPVQVLLAEQPDGPSTFQVYSQATNSREAHPSWVLHASAHIHPA